MRGPRGWATLIQMLDQSAVSDYLLSAGLVKPEAVVNEDLVVVDASRRNRVFVASTGEGPAYVVKQAEDGDGRALAHEAAVLRALARPLGALIPEVLDY